MINLPVWVVDRSCEDGDAQILEARIWAHRTDGHE